jgi:hypothetical protein
MHKANSCVVDMWRAWPQTMDSSGIALLSMLSALLPVLTKDPVVTALIAATVAVLHSCNLRLPQLLNIAKLWRSKKVVMEGRIVSTRYGTYCHMTKQMKGVLHHVHDNLDRIQGVSHVEAIDISTATHGDSERETLNVPVQPGRVDLGNDMFVKIEKSVIEERGHKGGHDGPVQVTRVEVTLGSSIPSLRFSEMAVFVEACAKEYDAFIQQTVASQMLFEYRCNDDTGKPVFDATPFVSSKTFDNLFFSGKRDIVARIAEFESPMGRARAHKLGMQHTLGFLFHGRPGSGKTSTIKAMANMTGRHLIVVRMDRIMQQNPMNCVDVLRSIMQSKKIGDICVPQDKRLCVLEEVDCWYTIMRARNMKSHKVPQGCGQSKNQSKPNVTAMILDVIKDAATAAAVASDAKDGQPTPPLPTAANDLSESLQLGGLLELFDGLIEMPGRMLVMTTNHPDRLDPALVRPGRIDIQHEFGCMGSEDVAELFKLWYGSTMPVTSVPSGRWTQAELAKMFGSCPDDPQRAMQLLLSGVAPPG